MIRFGTDGWRGIIADDFTFENLRLVTTSLCSYLLSQKNSNKEIFIGYDCRFMSKEFACFCAEILKEQGFLVLFSEDFIPTPVSAFYVLKKNLCGAVIITASHNPPTYNGYKFIPYYGGPATKDITEKIEENIKKRRTLKTKTKGRILKVNPKKEYISHLKKIINFSLIKKKKPVVCCDMLYGTSRGYLNKILKDICKKTYELNNFSDPYFGGKLPDPNKENLKRLSKLVKEKNAVLGLSCDQDADRFGIIGSKGEFYTPNQLGSILSYYLIKRKKLKGALARTVATTHLLDRIAKKEKREIIETPVGFKFIGEEMRKKEVVLGLEESGGLSIKPHIPEKDGILACLLVLEMVACEKKSLKEIFSFVEKEYGKVYNQRVDIHLKKDEKKKIMKRLKKAKPHKIANCKVLKLIKIDGIKFILSNNAWILVRPSGTEELIRMYVEVERKKDLLDIINWMKKFMEVS
jgi:phosphomannomutase